MRQQNELFLPSMTPPREEFFKNDLIFLGDMPSGPPTPALSDHFCKLVKEFVGDMGGGLVILSGPRFGPQQLAKTPLADLLPVTVDPAAGSATRSRLHCSSRPRRRDTPSCNWAASRVAAGDAAGLGHHGSLALVSAGGRHPGRRPPCWPSIPPPPAPTARSSP